MSAIRVKEFLAEWRTYRCLADAWALIWLRHGFVNETLVETLNYSGYTTPDSMGWAHFSFPFKAPAAQTTLMFQDVSGQNDYQGIALDGLKVTPT